jgi:hypothetical protein
LVCVSFQEEREIKRNTVEVSITGTINTIRAHEGYHMLL